MGIKMKKNSMIDYNLSINDFLQDVAAWLSKREPRDSTESHEIADTKEMWTKVCGAPRYYVGYERLYSDVCNHAGGFFVKDAVNHSDSTMYFAITGVLLDMDKYYRIGGENEKFELAYSLKKYKMVRAKNAFERFKVSIKRPERLLSTRQR